MGAKGVELPEEMVILVSMSCVGDEIGRGGCGDLGPVEDPVFDS